MGKYFKYAIGEILLVVIGILIALQINTWNDLNVKQKQKQVYTKSLINNLEQDSIKLSAFLTKTEKSYIKIKNQIGRIYGTTATADSLIKIARYEFDQSTNIFANTFQNETFKTLVASGDIELFDNEIANDLMELNSLQEQTILGIKTHNQNYINQLTKYGERYPMVSSVPKKESPVQKMLWKDINEKEFSSLFMSTVVLKAVLISYGSTYYTEILNRVTDLLSKLRKQSLS